MCAASSARGAIAARGTAPAAAFCSAPSPRPTPCTPPRPRGSGPIFPTWRSTGVPGNAGGVDDGIVVIEQTVREEALLEIEPQPLDRIELGRVGRQLQQRDVAGYLKIVGDVPSGLIGEHGHVLVVGDGLG